MSLFDADDYLALADEPLAPAPQDPAEPEALIEVLEHLPADAPETLVESLTEDIAIAEVGTVTSLAEPEPEPEPEPDVEPPFMEPDGPIERVVSVDQLWSHVIAQDAVVSALKAAAMKPVHAYLLVGPSGVGVRQAATAFSAALLCPRGGCSVCAHCSRALSEIHPDLIVVEREGASISVDQAREIIRLATRSPVEGDRKVLVLVDFHLVTNAASTLLKIIEEPPESTVFVILADHLPPELVTIASRCVQVPFRRLSTPDIVSVLIERGTPDDAAQRAAAAAGGRLDRAILLADDDHLAARLSFWEQIPHRLDGSGAAVASLAAESVALLDAAAVGPLETRQAEELVALEARLETTGGKGQAGQRKELVERHKRELKRLRDDELRVGLFALQRAYRDALVEAQVADSAALSALDALETANAHLERNPNLGLMLQSLYLRLAPLPAR
jgi:DNA polymerase III subunit delta'